MIRGPVIRGPVIRGPVIQGPVIQGPVIHRPPDFGKTLCTARKKAFDRLLFSHRKWVFSLSLSEIFIENCAGHSSRAAEKRRRQSFPRPGPHIVVPEEPWETISLPWSP